jgi:hypothetical protein
MLRFLARALGLLLVAAGFVGLVVDATRSLANSRTSFTSLGDLAAILFPRSFPLLEPAIAGQVHPFLWDPILLNFFVLPASVLSFVIGALLLWLGQKPEEPIGYPAEG